MPWYLWWLLPTAFGVGAALVLDEFALWLNLRDVYWTEEGRRSIDAVIIAAALIAIVALGAPFWGQVISGADPAGGFLIVAYHSVSVVAAVICLAKGKLDHRRDRLPALAGRALFGALRLARAQLAVGAAALRRRQDGAAPATRYPDEAQEADEASRREATVAGAR